MTIAVVIALFYIPTRIIVIVHSLSNAYSYHGSRSFMIECALNEILDEMFDRDVMQIIVKQSAQY